MPARRAISSRIAFGAKSAEQVLLGKKTATFRKWSKARVEAGDVYDAARIGYPPRKFAKVGAPGSGGSGSGRLTNALL
jgi:hypothetical protein